jgi:hypothetical protein
MDSTLKEGRDLGKPEGLPIGTGLEEKRLFLYNLS